MIEKFKTLFFVKSSLISLYLALTIPLPFISIDKLKILSILIFVLGLYLIVNLIMLRLAIIKFHIKVALFLKP